MTEGQVAQVAEALPSQRLEVADEAGAADGARRRRSLGARRISRSAEADALVERAGGLVVQAGVERHAREAGLGGGLGRRAASSAVATPRRRKPGATASAST